MLSTRCNIKISLNHEEIKKEPQGISKVIPFMNRYKWEGINYP